MTPEPQKLDSDGTTGTEATAMLQKLLGAFENDREKLAIALGRDSGEISHALSGNNEAFDDDLLMKMRALAQRRDIEI